MIFVDSGAFIGRYLADDQHHADAVAGWARITESRAPCCTSNHVVSEVLTLLSRRAGGRFAAETGRLIYASRVLQILRTTREDELLALDFFAKFSDQQVSFTDCLSFALMRRHSLQRVFSFDRHFTLAGFKREF